MAGRCSRRDRAEWFSCFLPAAERPPRSGHPLRGNAGMTGEGNEKRLVGEKEIEDAGEKSRIGSGTAKRRRAYPRYRQEPPQRLRLARYIAKCLDRQRFGRFPLCSGAAVLHFHLPFRKKSALPLQITQGIGVSNGG